MRRKTPIEDRPDRAEADDAVDETVEVDNVDPHGFWDGANLSGDDHDEAFAVVIDAEGDPADDKETLAYMGSVPQTRIDADELEALVGWAEAKACRNCRRKIREHHDPELLKHDECRTALRVARVLRRSGS